MQLVTESPDDYETVIDQCNFEVVVKNPLSGPIGQDLDLIICANILSNNLITLLKNIADSLKFNGFVLLKETGNITKTNLKDAGLLFVAKQVFPGGSYILLKKEENSVEPIIIQITEKNFSWLEPLKKALKKAQTDDQKILLVSQDEETLGIKVYKI